MPRPSSAERGGSRMNVQIARTLKVGLKDVADKIGGLAKDVAGVVTGDRSLREEGQAQLDQAHLEPEGAAVDAEERGRDDAALPRIRKL